LVEATAGPPPLSMPRPASPTVFLGSGMFIPDPGSEFFPSRIRDKEFKTVGSDCRPTTVVHAKACITNSVFIYLFIFYPEFRIRDVFLPDPGSEFFSIFDPRQRI
jgi:hypothetical protein